MQKVIIKTNVFGGRTTFTINDVVISEIVQSISAIGRYFGVVYDFSGSKVVCDNCDYIDALERTSDDIENRFNKVGLKVVFS